MSLRRPLFLSMFVFFGATGASVASDWFHEGSIVHLEATGNGGRTFTYSSPARGLVGVKQGDVLFTGTNSGNSFSGKAYALARGCDPVPFDVTGGASESQTSIVLDGERPRLDSSCNIIGTEPYKLVFNLQKPRTQPTASGDNVYQTCAEKKSNGYVLEENEIDYCGGLPRKGDGLAGRTTAEQKRNYNDALRIDEQNARDDAERDRRLAEQARREKEEAAHRLVVHMTSYDRHVLRAMFFAKERDAVWGRSGDNALYTNDTKTFRFTCRPGEKICYGAWRTPGHKSWGVGPSGNESCQNCCMHCGYEYTKNLGAAPEDPPEEVRRSGGGGSGGEGGDSGGGSSVSAGDVATFAGAAAGLAGVFARQRGGGGGSIPSGHSNNQQSDITHR